MLKHFIIFVFLLFIVHTPTTMNAEELDDIREEVFQFVKEAFEAQVSITEKPRRLHEIRDILSPFFAAERIEAFIEENVVKVEGGYVALGTDMPPLEVVPFFRYSEKTKLIKDNDVYYVIEYMESTDGPVHFDPHYEGIQVKKTETSYVIEKIWKEQLPDHVEQKIGIGENREQTNVKYVDNQLPFVVMVADIPKKLPLFSTFVPLIG
ncbi:MAG: DUF3993 domain-containing protein [Bacillus sp. (in: Bacteria)]|nr:DUF3993 domain-containing protein [Bacillus sp. (in: firmicutes)]